MTGPTFFENGAAFRRWLEAHAASETELLVGFYKVGSGKPSMTWPESVDEALCFGWIDGVRKRIDDQAYTIRFTPRNPKSVWSQRNIDLVERLSSEGRMKPAGLAAYAHRDVHPESGYRVADHASELTDALGQRFQERADAWSYFEACPPSYRKQVLHWIMSAKQPATQARRLEKLIEACANQKRLA